MSIKCELKWIGCGAPGGIFRWSVFVPGAGAGRRARHSPPHGPATAEHGGRGPIHTSDVPRARVGKGGGYAVSVSYLDDFRAIYCKSRTHKHTGFILPFFNMQTGADFSLSISILLFRRELKKIF